VTAVRVPQLHYTFSFNYGDATPRTLMRCPPGVTVERVAVLILTAFDGVNASLTVGDEDDPDLFLATSDIEVDTEGTFEARPALRYGAETGIILTINPGTGPSAGSGLVTVDLSN
jgi:hypothetical protein